MTDKFLTELDDKQAAQKFRDLYPLLVQLCEARKGAQPEPWKSASAELPHVGARIYFGRRSGGVALHKDTPYGTENAFFTALSANLTTQIQKILEGK